MSNITTTSKYFDIPFDSPGDITTAPVGCDGPESSRFAGCS